MASQQSCRCSPGACAVANCVNEYDPSILSEGPRATSDLVAMDTPEQAQCPRKRAAKKGSDAHIEMETCLDCNKVLKKQPRVDAAHGGVRPNASRLTEARKLCENLRLSWKGSNGHQWRPTCTACGLDGARNNQEHDRVKASASKASF